MGASLLALLKLYCCYYYYYCCCCYYYYYYYCRHPSFSNKTKVLRSNWWFSNKSCEVRNTMTVPSAKWSEFLVYLSFVSLSPLVR